MPRFEHFKRLEQVGNPDNWGCTWRVLVGSAGIILIGFLAYRNVGEKGRNTTVQRGPQNAQVRVIDLSDLGIGKRAADVIESNGTTIASSTPAIEPSSIHPTPMAPETILQAVKPKEYPYMDPEEVRQRLLELQATKDSILMVCVFESGILKIKEASPVGDPNHGSVGLKLTDSSFGEIISDDTIYSIDLSREQR